MIRYIWKITFCGEFGDFRVIKEQLSMANTYIQIVRYIYIVSDTFANTFMESNTFPNAFMELRLEFLLGSVAFILLK